MLITFFEVGLGLKNPRRINSSQSKRIDYCAYICYMYFSMASDCDYCDHMRRMPPAWFRVLQVWGGVLHTYRHGLASVERADRRLSLGVCGELHKSAA